MSTTVSYHLFQIIEETLTNMVKHANATKASLRIKVHGNNVEVALQDNGDGVEKPVIKKGSGLWMMKERALLMGGKLRLESAKNRFFRIRLSFSL
jgi:signal transduction histidine kinase